MARRRRKISLEELKKIEEQTKTIPCAFCKGTGTDPFPVLSPLSNCPVCHGRGIVRVREPFETCPACQGTGLYFNSHMYCWHCRGKGVVTIRKE